MTYNLTLENKYFKISTFGREGLALYFHILFEQNSNCENLAMNTLFPKIANTSCSSSESQMLSH